MNETLADLAAQHDELRVLLEPLDGTQWQRGSPCDGWDIADVVLHLHQTDELALASLRGDLTAALEDFMRGDGLAAESVDAAAAVSVQQARGSSGREVLARWSDSAAELCAAFARADPHDRVQWVVGQLTTRTLAVTRLSECWIHTTDVAVALGRELEPTNRLRSIARLAWRTLPYAFERAGRPLHGPVAVDLVGPTGDRWAFGTDDDPATVVSGAAEEFCLVAGRRRAPEATNLVATGVDAQGVLELVRTYA